MSAKCWHLLSVELKFDYVIYHQHFEAPTSGPPDLLMLLLLLLPKVALVTPLRVHLNLSDLMMSRASEKLLKILAIIGPLILLD